MREFKVVSIDMFGTLVDVNSVRHDVWRTFLKAMYTTELADKYWTHASDMVFKYIQDKVIRDRIYVPPKTIFEMTYIRLFADFGVDFDPKEAAVVLAKHHSLSPPFDDTRSFLNAVGAVYPVCLSTDTDEDMLGPLRQLYPFSRVVTSEEMGAYKTNADNRFFNEVIKHFSVSPGDIIHIGDSAADIIGANEAGIVSCWLNRKNRVLPEGTKPDYQVKSLVEAASILGVNI
jgi:FMN phosphatase YigB (HAD superfamily)